MPRPTCTGVTSLGIDHVTVLGNTLESIAWHKGGIFKEGVAALTVEQPSGALEVLRQRAEERGVYLLQRLILGGVSSCSDSSCVERRGVGDSWTSATK